MESRGCVRRVAEGDDGRKPGNKVLPNLSCFSLAEWIHHQTQHRSKWQTRTFWYTQCELTICSSLIIECALACVHTDDVQKSFKYKFTVNGIDKQCDLTPFHIICIQYFINVVYTLMVKPFGCIFRSIHFRLKCFVCTLYAMSIIVYVNVDGINAV